jgi:hypothetical protein
MPAVTESLIPGSNQTVDEFYATLTNFVNSGDVISISNYSQPAHSQIVKNVQIGLSFLGYPLPPSEMTGLLGPQTLAALNNFRRSGGTDVPKDKVKNYVVDPNRKLRAVDFQQDYGLY